MVGLYYDLGADLIIAETNQGGEMVRQILHSVDPMVPVKSAHASRGKWLRAEPVSMLYERGLVCHIGRFDALEDQMCEIGPDGTVNGASPDRLDALVWALTELMLENQSVPRVRSV